MNAETKLSLHRLRRVAEHADRLRGRNPSLALWAIPWMNFKHPVHPTQRRLAENLVEGDRIRRIPMTLLLLRAIWSGCYALWFAGRLAALRWGLRAALRRWENLSFDWIGKTWCFDADPSPEKADFYFGDLLKRFSSRGIRALLLWGDSRGKNWKARPLREPDSTGYFPELLLAPLLSPLQMWREQIRACRILVRQHRRASDPLFAAVAGQAAMDSMSHRILPVGLYFWIGREAVRRFRPKGFLTLYEGHGWEQCLWQGIRAADPSCRILGYQHSILLPHNLALLGDKRPAGAPRTPDGVLCLGPRTLEMLRPSHSSSGLVVFGSFRREPSVRRMGPRPGVRTVLVLPEGHPEEARLLFSEAGRLAKELPDHRFVLRSHPVLPFEFVRAGLEEDPTIHPNVSLAAPRPLSEDLAEASVVLYRGSSSVLYAVLAGLKPIYLENRSLGEIDPLFELEGWRERAERSEGLEAILRRYGDSEQTLERGLWESAARYVEEYAVPVTEQAIDAILNLQGLPGHSLEDAVA